MYKDYTKKYIKRIFVSVFFTVLLAASTSSDCLSFRSCNKTTFYRKKEIINLIIPGLIVLAFAVKGSSLYIAKVIMINVAAEVRKDMQVICYQH